MTKKKLLFLVNDLSFFCSHRLPIAEFSIKHGYEVVIGYGELGGADVPTLKNKGFKLSKVSMDRGGKNIFQDMIAFIKIWKFFNHENPDIVHLITIKPYLYGGVLARMNRIPCVVSAVSGLGTLFIHRDLKSKLTRLMLYPLYRFAFNHPNQSVIFQNKDDFEMLNSWGVLNQKNIKFIKGSGVDINKFNKLKESDGVPVVCFASRLLVDKGINEFISAAKILKERDVNVRFWIAGDIDKKNPSSLTDNELKKIKEDGIVEILGFQNNIPKLYEMSHIVCLPSYREGLPKALVEAAAASRAVITSDVAGCRDAINPDISGLLVPVKDEIALADAIHYLISNPVRRKEMGKEGRAMAQKEFKIEKIVQSHMLIYRELLETFDQ